jgi:SAM-dependent methyltransferase
MHSPLSQLPAQQVRQLTRDFLLAQLEDYFHATPPPGVVETDYTLWRCAETGLEFSDPPLPGNALFYEWISSFECYYPGFRWEYGEVARMIRDGLGQSPDFKILDVGSGKGDFLRSLDFLAPPQKAALDMNEPAIQACREQGVRAFCGTVETAIAGGFLQPGEYPVVTSFHCLEHVSDPVAFLRELLRAATPGGKVYVSTPYSPMSFEDDWFDVMNHPPHHMARWNLAAYREVSKILGVEMHYFMPRNRTLKQALGKFRLKTYGPNVTVPPATQVKDLLLQAPKFLLTWWRLFQRAKSHAIGGTDVILIEFTAP